MHCFSHTPIHKQQKTTAMQMIIEFEKVNMSVKKFTISKFTAIDQNDARVEIYTRV